MEGNKPIYLTEEGLQKLKDELQFMRTHERARIAKSIADARAQGDLSENAEYDAAKEEQGHLEARIAKIEQTITDARLVDDSKIDTSKAYILSTVKVKDMKSGKEMTYKLVSKEEADIMTGKISVVSPIGKGLLGLSVGDVTEIEVPAGRLKLKVLEISR